MAGDMLLRKSRPGEATKGLRSSDGKVPDPGVCNDDEEEEEAPELDLFSKPAAAIVAVEADDIVLCRRLRAVVSNTGVERSRKQ
ncbi:hypothetical protein KC346_g17109 [Hortaea werneckii]|nr:hypothetical protein KC346_g17109 [Hortaea werneckii]